MGALSALQHLMSEGAKTDDDDDNITVDGVILCGALIQVAPGVLPPKVDAVQYELGIDVQYSFYNVH